jgi:hypothetical protein
VAHALHPLRDTPFGQVIRTLLSQIAVNRAIGDPFRATVVEARRGEIGKVMARGVARGDLRPDADPTIATELLVGPVYFRLIFGGDMSDAFANRIADTVFEAYAVQRG